RVLVPVELPEGVSREGALGVEPVGEPVRVGSWGMVLVQSAAGDVVVGSVDEGGEAARRGVRPGEVLATCDRVLLRGLPHLESLLVASSGTVSLGFRSGGGTEGAPAASALERAFPAP
ncbi:MAG: hypothetical protein HY722_14100, partial [Planctomycetes bacterium]|nr:hypothetical protein [Planctomycetota bacterium]